MVLRDYGKPTGIPDSGEDNISRGEHRQDLQQFPDDVWVDWLRLLTDIPFAYICILGILGGSSH